MPRKKTPTTRLDFCRPIAQALFEFGYPSVTVEQIKEVLDAYLDGKETLPHGVIGFWAKRSFEELPIDRLRLLKE